MDGGFPGFGLRQLLAQLALEMLSRSTPAKDRRSSLGHPDIYCNSSRRENKKKTKVEKWEMTVEVES